jgi:hypothetical protein
MVIYVAYLAAGKLRVCLPMSLDFSIDLPCSRNMALGLTQPLREMSTSNLPRGKGRLARKANFTAICEPNI